MLFVAFVVSRLLRTRTQGLSIRMQVFLALAFIVGVFAFGLGLMVVDRVEARAARLAKAAAQDEAVTIAAILQSEIDGNGTTVAAMAKQLRDETGMPKRRELSGESAPTAGLGLELLDASGAVVFPERERSRAEEPGAVFVDVGLTSGGKRAGAVRVVKPTIVVQALLADFAPTVLVISLVLGAAAAIAAAWIGRTIAEPIEALSEFSERVSEGERTRLPTRVAGREVARLVQSIDSMRRQLEGRPFVEAFAADLSHELKNPVAAIRASAEILEESALEEPDEARRFVRRIREAAGRIERLLGDLLNLARIEARGAETFDPVDVGALCRRAIQAQGSAAKRFVVEIAGDVRVRGHETWLARAIGNLVENAVTHGAPEESIRVVVSSDRQDVTLRVENPGEIPRRVQERLFRRFVTTRADKGGSGLGLAIVRAVVEAHGGRVELVNAGPPTVILSVRLPAD